MIRAMKKIVKRYDDVLYVIAGETHPNVLKNHGDRYRDKLVSITEKYGLENNVKFVDRYFDLSELIKYLYASDFYIVPYQVPRQIVSGTLSYAVSAGKAVITTPMKCAEEYIRKGVVVQVPFHNYRRFAKEVCRLIGDKEEMFSLRKKAYDYGRGMIWEEVSREYIDVFTSSARGVIRSGT